MKKGKGDVEVIKELRADVNKWLDDQQMVEEEKGSKKKKLKSIEIFEGLRWKIKRRIPKF